MIIITNIMMTGSMAWPALLGQCLCLCLYYCFQYIIHKPLLSFSFTILIWNDDREPTLFWARQKSKKKLLITFSTSSWLANATIELLSRSWMRFIDKPFFPERSRQKKWMKRKRKNWCLIKTVGWNLRAAVCLMEGQANNIILMGQILWNTTRIYSRSKNLVRALGLKYLEANEKVVDTFQKVAAGRQPNQTIELSFAMWIYLLLELDRGFFIQLFI